MTREELKAHYPHASSAFIELNCDRPEGIRSGDEKCTEGNALERPLPREETRDTRVTIRFTVYARRPADWDNYTVKELQDLLVMVGILDSDQWDYLEGQITSEKVHTKAEERTEITICSN